jgi:hypothetical protein
VVVRSPIFKTEIMDEIWKDIKGYKGVYQVSNLGRIKSLSRITKYKNHSQRTKERIMKPQDNRGYKQIYLRTTGKKNQKSLQIKRVVYEAFYNKIPKGYDIALIDGNKNNNALSNLTLKPKKEIYSKVELNVLLIAKAVAKAQDLRLVDILSPTRKSEIIINRQMAHYIACNYTNKEFLYNVPLRIIGRIIGDVKHSSVLSSLKSIDNLLSTSKVFAEIFRRVERDVYNAIYIDDYCI